MARINVSKQINTKYRDVIKKSKKSKKTKILYFEKNGE